MAHNHAENNGQQPPSENKETASSNKDEKNNLPPSNKSETPQTEKRTPKQVTITDTELEQLKKELNEYKDKYLRHLAESENARKRLQKEKQEMIQYALQNLIVDFLNPIDHMENALKFTQQMSEEVKHWAIGFQMILSQFKDVLSSNGVSSFVSEGKSFDPHRHEAIETIETSDFPAGIVVEETLKGYVMGDRVIRPARVKVSKLPIPQKQDTEAS